mmetsp:Transcript_63315/g.151045  ORF Transcript_63315/g.151045 Transcript_63315/m.151045 type:complete len:237 (-) Transcript_63315:34-744(-)
MLHERGKIMQDHVFLHLCLPTVVIPTLRCLIQYHNNVLHQQRDVHQLEGFHVHKTSPQQQTEGLLELLAFLFQLRLVVIVGLQCILDGVSTSSGIILPLLEVIHHPQAKIDFRLLHKDSNRILMRFLVPQGTFRISVASLCLVHFGVGWHSALQLHQSGELFQGIHQRNPFNGKDWVLMYVPHTSPASLCAYLHGTLRFTIFLLVFGCRIGRHPTPDKMRSPAYLAAAVPPASYIC